MITLLTHEETVLENGELKRELAETRQLLWLAVKEAGQWPGTVIVRTDHTPGNIGDLEIEKLPDFKTRITARTK